MKKRTRLRRCKCCGENFKPDPYNAHHQRFCSKDECQRISHCESSRRYRRKKRRENDEAHKKKENDRVKKWRKANPGFRVKQKINKKRRKLQALRDFVQGEKLLIDETLRDVLFLQLACFYGLILNLTGVLRDDIGGVMMNYYDMGKEFVPGLENLLTKGVFAHGAKGNHKSGPSPPTAGRLRLGGSPPSP